MPLHDIVTHTYAFQIVRFRYVCAIHVKKKKEHTIFLVVRLLDKSNKPKETKIEAKQKKIKKLTKAKVKQNKPKQKESKRKAKEKKSKTKHKKNLL